MTQDLSRRERKKRETRERILAVAREMIGNRGYEATTLEQIAEGADVSKATFYNYFPNKDELLRGIAAAEIAALGRLMAGESGQLTSPSAVIRRSMELAFSAKTSPEPLLPRIVLEFLMHPEKTPGPLAELGGSGADLIRQAQDQGELSSDLGPVQVNQVIGCAYIAASVFDRFMGDAISSTRDSCLLTTIAVAILNSVGIDWTVAEDA